MKPMGIKCFKFLSNTVGKWQNKYIFITLKIGITLIVQKYTMSKLTTKANWKTQGETL